MPSDNSHAARKIAERDIWGPVVLTPNRQAGNCACGDKRPHTHYVANLRAVQDWYKGRT